MNTGDLLTPICPLRSDFDTFLFRPTFVGRTYMRFFLARSILAGRDIRKEEWVVSLEYDEIFKFFLGVIEVKV